MRGDTASAPTIAFSPGDNLGLCGLHESSDDHKDDRIFIWRAEPIRVIGPCAPDTVQAMITADTYKAKENIDLVVWAPPCRERSAWAFHVQQSRLRSMDSTA